MLVLVKIKNLKNTKLPAFLIMLATGLVFTVGQASATVVSTNICQSNKPVINSPADNEEVSTKDITLAGKADARVTITVNDNGQTAGITTATDSGAFSVAITLQEGRNVIYLQSENACGQKTLSAPFTINKVPKKTIIFAPVLEPILEPLPGPIEKPITELLDMAPSIVSVTLLAFIVCCALWIGGFLLRRLYIIFSARRRRSKKTARKKSGRKPRRK